MTPRRFYSRGTVNPDVRDYVEEMEELREKLLAVPCPYCPNPDRRSVFDNWKGCQFDHAAAEELGIIGADPPCVGDDFPTDWQLAQLGLAGRYDRFGRYLLWACIFAPVLAMLFIRWVIG